MSRNRYDHNGDPSKEQMHTVIVTLMHECGVKEIDFSDGHHLRLTFDDGTEKTLFHPEPQS
jgi:hypothetical protein